MLYDSERDAKSGFLNDLATFSSELKDMDFAMLISRKQGDKEVGVSITTSEQETCYFTVVEALFTLLNSFELDENHLGALGYSIADICHNHGGDWDTVLDIFNGMGLWLNIHESKLSKNEGEYYE